MSDTVGEADRKVRAAADLYYQGDNVGAERGCRQALALVAGHRDARILLGLVLYAQRRYDDAENVFGALALQEPDQSMHWSNLGTARRGAKRLDEALAAYARAAELGDASANFYYNVGLLQVDRLDFEAAHAVLQRAAALAPLDFEIRYRYAKACSDCRRPEEAAAALAGWESAPDLPLELTANIATLLMNLGDSARAEVALERVAAAANPDPQTSLLLVQALERTNRLADARVRLDRLSKDPRAGSLGVELLLTEAQLAERESKYESAVQLLQDALRDIPELPLRHFQLFRLAKCLDALNRPSEAFNALSEAHRSQIAYFKMSAPAVSLRGVPTMTITRFGCDVADVASWDDSAAPSRAQSPIFIVAFPRSGTTLLELTLDAHPLLKSMDEQTFIQSALDGLNATGAQYPEQLGRVTAEQLAAVRADYWARVARKVSLAPGQRLVDKNPLNILRLPVIRRLFPNAQILLAVRHPCDVLFSCFLQHFRSPDFALLCADLGTLGRGYRRTMDYWYQQAGLLKPSICEVRYESFVADFEAQIRGITGFLGLPWDDGLLAPAAHARSKGYISTPSYSQVIQPVNRKSVGKWRAYRQHFAEVLPVLRPYLDRWGYDT